MFLLDDDTATRLIRHDLDSLSESAVKRLADMQLIVHDGDSEASQLLEPRSTHSTTRKFAIMPTAHCNMGCNYCGQAHSRTHFTRRDEERVLERIRAAAYAEEVENIQIDWFGGEPLTAIATIRRIAARAILFCRSTGTTYSSLIVTNGSLLSHSKARLLLHECQVKRVEITLDGPRRTHDVSRLLLNGQQSFDRIVRTIKNILDDPELEDLIFTVRTNVSVAIKDVAEEFAYTMVEAGLRHPRVYFYAVPIHSWGNDVSGIAVQDKRDFAAIDMAWLRAYVDAGLNVGLFPSHTVEHTCMAVTTSAELIDPSGLVFSCTEQPLVPTHTDEALTDIYSMEPQAHRPLGRFDNWYAHVKARKVPCHQCSILPICGGACPKAWLEGSEPCPPIKRNWEERLDLVALRRGLVLADVRAQATADRC